jgi:conjugal transfer pilus assembly protein TraE
MNYKQFLTSYQGSRITAAIAVCLLALMTLTNAILVFTLANRHDSVILVPPHLTEEVRVTIGKSTEGYMKAWGLFIAELIGNVSPKNLQFIRTSLEPLLAPSVYQQFVNVLELQTQQIMVDHISMRFEPKLVQYEEETGLVFVSGQGIVVGPTGDEKIMQRTYEFAVEMDDFRPLLTWIDTYPGGAQTLKVKERLEKSKNRDKRGNK